MLVALLICLVVRLLVFVLCFARGKHQRQNGGVKEMGTVGGFDTGDIMNRSL